MSLPKTVLVAEPATVVVTACPVAGKEHDWEQALGDWIRTSLTFPGHLGCIVLKPQSPAERRYRIITKFDSPENMQHWYASPERQERVARLRALEVRPAEVQHLTGLETWFELPQDDAPVAAPPPPKYKMATIIWIAVYVTVLPLIGVLKPFTAPLPAALGSALLAAISVILMTWIVMPLLTWIFRFWLFPSPRRPSSTF